MSNIPNCNLLYNGKDIYSSTASGIGSGIGGFFGMILNSVLFVILLIIYLLSRNNIVLLFTILSLAGGIYSYYKMTSGGKNLPERPCIKNGVILN